VRTPIPLSAVARLRDEHVAQTVMIETLFEVWETPGLIPDMTILKTTAIRRDRQRLQGILPWYLNGTLADADRVWVEQRLRADETGIADAATRGLAFDRRIVAALAQKVAELPAGIGWERLMRQVRNDAVPSVAAADQPKLGLVSARTTPS